MWEIWEFFCFLVFGNDAQKHLTTGVFDTMEDLIACMVGSAIMLIDYLVYLHFGKGLLMGLVISFDRANGWQPEGTLDALQEKGESEG